MSFVALGLMLAIGAPSGGNLPEWSAMQRRLAQDRLRVRFLRREELTIKQGVRELDRDMRKLEKRIESLEVQADTTRDRIEELDLRIDAIEKRMATLRKTVGRRAAAMIRMRRTNLASILAHAVTPAETRRMKERLSRVFAFDADLVRTVRAASAQDREAREELEKELTAFQTTMDTLEEEGNEARLLREERAALLEAISSERKASGRLLASLLTASRRLQRELGVVRGERPAPEPAPGGFAQQKGRLPWPVTGKVESIFGNAVDPTSSMVMVQHGIDIRAPQSTLVRSVFDGKVAYAGRLAGLGRIVIVDHDGYFSVYAHLERLHVRVGQRIAQYHVVGLVGDSDSSKGAFLYFELRHGAEGIDPLLWLVEG